MTDWYYHHPSEGRVGPLTGEQLRERYRERRLQMDTLVWHAGLREWQPLSSQAEALDLAAITPDPTRPPPLPSAAFDPRHAAAQYAHVPPKKGMSGCLIALIVGAVVAVPLLAVMAAIAIPAYQDYTMRAKVAEAMHATRELKVAINTHWAAHAACPSEDSEGFDAPNLTTSPYIASTQLGELDDGSCGFVVALRGLNPRLDGQTLEFVAARNADQVQWTCTGGNLPARYRPLACRADPSH